MQIARESNLIKFKYYQTCQFSYAGISRNRILEYLKQSLTLTTTGNEISSGASINLNNKNASGPISGLIIYFRLVVLMEFGNQTHIRFHGIQYWERCRLIGANTRTFIVYCRIGVIRMESTRYKFEYNVTGILNFIIDWVKENVKGKWWNDNKYFFISGILLYRVL